MVQSWTGKWRIAALAALFVLLLVAVRHADALLGESWSSAVTEKGKIVKLLLVAGCLGAFLWAVHLFIKPILSCPRLPRYAILVSLLVSCTTILFLLPPFQGPDEFQHWWFVVSYYRSEGKNDPAYALPEHLKSFDIPAKKEQRQDTPSFHRPLQPGHAGGDPASYGYVRWYSYPLAAAVALIYPRTTTTAEALHFYYLCRAVPAVVLLLLLFWANRRHLVPYTALMLVSLPIFLQQCCIVSVDNFLLLGTLATVLLFLRLWRTPSVPLTLALWALCLVLTCSKSIVAGLLLLPLALLPLRKIPLKKIVVPIGILAGASAAVWLLSGAVNSLKVTGGHYGPEQVESQIALLHTWDGIRAFFGMYWQMLAELCRLDRWSEHLGWLDTPLSQLHLTLIRFSFLAAVLLDLCQFGPLLRRVWRERRSEVLLVAGIAAVTLAVNSLGVALAYFVIGVRPGGAYLEAWQARHFFPGLIVLVMLPMLLFDGLDPAPQPAGLRVTPTGSSETRFLPAALNGVALAALPLLLFSRTVELAVDLMTRYW